MSQSDPEVVFLQPLHGEDKRSIAWQCLMVEHGIHFAFGDRYQLPEKLPEEMGGIKLVLIDPESWDEYHSGQTGRGLEQIEAKGGVINCLRGPVDFHAIDENAIRGDFEMMVASADLTLDHPAIRTRLQSRTFRQLYDELREPYFMRQLDLGLRRDPWNEPYSYNILHTVELFDEYDPRFGWSDRLRGILDHLMDKVENDLKHIDRTTGLDVFARMSRRTGDSRYLDFAAERVRRIADTFPRICGVPVLQPKRDHIIWNESLAHYPPAALIAGVDTGDESLVDLALHCATAVRELNFCPEKNLWYHAGRPGWRGPAIWGRGQAWALTGITGLLRHLPEGHAGKPTLEGYLREILEGLLATQTDEGVWRNILDDPRSRTALRATSMFVYCFAEAKRRGWVDDPRLDDMLERAWRGVRGRVWRDRLCTVCCGTGAGFSYHHYMSRPHLFYGASSALRAGVSYVLAYGEDETHGLREDT